MEPKIIFVFINNYYLICFITQILFMLTPIAFFIKLKCGSIYNESIIGLLSFCSNAELYFMIYLFAEGIDALNFSLLISFLLGILYLALYIHIFIYKKGHKIKAVIFYIIILAIPFLVYIITNLTVRENNTWYIIFSWIGVIFNVAEYFPLDFDIKYLFRNKISDNFLLIGIAIGFLNCVSWLCWAINGVVSGEYNLYHSIVANCLGICLEISEIIIFILFKRYNLKNIGNNEIKEIEINKPNDIANNEIKERIISGNDNNIEIGKSNDSDNNSFHVDEFV